MHDMKFKTWFSVIVVSLMMSFGGCVSTHTANRITPTTTTQNEPMWIRTELYFGRATPTDEVSDDQWTQFVDEVITPAFPDGLSIDDLAGQWKNPDGKIVHERSKCVMIFHPDSAESNDKIDLIRKKYVEQFKQDSVMKVESPARVKF
jgi:hypothetical protein